WDGEGLYSTHMAGSKAFANVILDWGSEQEIEYSEEDDDDENIEWVDNNEEEEKNDDGKSIDLEKTDDEETDNEFVYNVERDEEMTNAEDADIGNGDEENTNATKEDTEKTEEVKDEIKKMKLPPASSSLFVSSGFGSDDFRNSKSLLKKYSVATVRQPGRPFKGRGLAILKISSSTGSSVVADLPDLELLAGDLPLDDSLETIQSSPCSQLAEDTSVTVLLIVVTDEASVVIGGVGIGVVDCSGTGGMVETEGGGRRVVAGATKGVSVSSFVALVFSSSPFPMSASSAFVISSSLSLFTYSSSCTDSSSIMVSTMTTRNAGRHTAATRGGGTSEQDGRGGERSGDQAGNGRGSKGSGRDFKTFIKEEFCPNNEMQKLETEFWCHAMVRAGHAAYTNRFHELARLVTYLVTHENKRIERNGALKKIIGKRWNSRELSRDGKDRDDNKRPKTGRVFATITNPVRKEYTGTAPKCLNCSFYHNSEIPYRKYTNCNRLRHFAKDCRARLRMATPVNTGNPNAAHGTCFECGEHIIVAGAENRPPVLEKSMYDSWASRIHLFIKGKKHGRMMLDSIDNGPLLSSASQQSYPSPAPQRFYDAPIIQQLHFQPQVATHSQVVQQQLYQASALQQSYQALAIPQPMQPSFLELDLGLLVLSFILIDDPIASLNKEMVQGAPVQDGVVKCYNCQEERHFARQCTKPKRPNNSAWFKEKMLLFKALESRAYLDPK
nr:reverse transcriptase domain-containing protein [Tanacetum cinerariifolium]